MVQEDILNFAQDVFHKVQFHTSNFRNSSQHRGPLLYSFTIEALIGI